MNEDNVSRALRDIDRQRRIEREKRRRLIKRQLTVVIIIMIVFFSLAGAAGYILFIKPAIEKGRTEKEAAVQTEEYQSIGERVSEDAAEPDSDKTGTVTDAAVYADEFEQTVVNMASEEAAAPEVRDFDIEMTFIGDCCMASDLENRSEGSMLWSEENLPSTYFFEKVNQHFMDDDLTVANCENVFSDSQGVLRDKGEDGGFWFKSPARYAGILKDGGIDAVSICNNHTLDYGKDALEDTGEALDAAGVDWGLRDKIIYYEKEGYRIAIVCVAYYNFNEVYDAAAYLKEAEENSDFQVIYFHGGKEYEPNPENWKVSACRYLVDEGADLVIGAHPHCLQRIEEYGGAEIVYSLGNFCFGGNNYPKTNKTIIYKCYLTIHEEDGVQTLSAKSREIIPCYVYTGDRNNWQPAPIEDKAEAEQVVAFMNGETETP